MIVRPPAPFPPILTWELEDFEFGFIGRGGGRDFQNSWRTLSWGMKNKNNWGDACSMDKVSGCTMVLEFLEFLKLLWIFLAL